MKNRISIKYAFFCGTACCISSILRAQQDASQMNVLFIMADDMRPELGCYGVDVVKTPNMDRLAASGVLFQNAYCNIPVSGASRASLLTGVYPHYPDRFISFPPMPQRLSRSNTYFGMVHPEWLSYYFGRQGVSSYQRSCGFVE